MQRTLKENVSTTITSDTWTPDDEGFDDDIESYEEYVDPYPDPVSLQPAIRRWWWWFILAAMISAPIAFFVSKEIAVDSYVFGTRLLFNRSHFGAPLYEPPDIFALASLATSPKVLHKLKHEMRLQPDVERLASLLEPDVRNGSTVMTMQLEWEEPEKAKKILEWLNEYLVTRVKELRDERVDASLNDLKKQLAMYEEAAEKGHEEIVNFRSKHDTFGVLDNLRRIETYQTSLQHDLNIAVSEMEALGSHIKGVDSMAKDLEAVAKKEEELTEDDLDSVDLTVGNPETNEAEKIAEQEAEAERKRQYEAVMNRIKQARLQQSIREESERSLLATQIELKQNELNDARRLYARQLIPQLEVRQLEDSLRLLNLELQGTRKLQAWEQELDAVTSQVDEDMLTAVKSGGKVRLPSVPGNIMQPTANVANADNSRGVDPEARYLAELRERWQLQFDTKKSFVDRINVQIEQTQNEKEEMRKILPESERLDRRFARSEFQRSRVEGQVSEMEMLRRSDSNLLSVLDEPSPGPIPVKSNRKKLMVAIYGLSICILCAPILVKELVAPVKNTLQNPSTATLPR